MLCVMLVNMHASRQARCTFFFPQGPPFGAGGGGIVHACTERSAGAGGLITRLPDGVIKTWAGGGETRRLYTLLDHHHGSCPGLLGGVTGRSFAGGASFALAGGACGPSFGKLGGGGLGRFPGLAFCFGGGFALTRSMLSSGAAAFGALGGMPFEVSCSLFFGCAGCFAELDDTCKSCSVLMRNACMPDMNCNVGRRPQPEEGSLPPSPPE